MEGITERFTVSLTDRELVIGAIDSGRKKRLHLTAGEALTLLDILRKEESKLKQMAHENEAYKNGCECALHGTPSDNPHEHGSKLWTSWNKGFSITFREVKAKREMLEHEFDGETLKIEIPEELRNNFMQFCDELKKIASEYPPGTFRTLKHIDFEWTDFNIEIGEETCLL